MVVGQDGFFMREGTQTEGGDRVYTGCRLLKPGVDKPFRNPRRMMVFYCAISQEVPSAPCGRPIFVCHLSRRWPAEDHRTVMDSPTPSSGGFSTLFQFPL